MTVTDSLGEYLKLYLDKEKNEKTGLREQAADVIIFFACFAISNLDNNANNDDINSPCIMTLLFHNSSINMRQI
jgi:hypothetical protein